MVRSRLTVLAATGMTCLLTAFLVANQQSGQNKPMQGHDMSMAPTKTTKNDMKMTKTQKIANAITAGPASITAKATVYDWPSKEGMAPEVLRPGTNGWSCFPDAPDTQGNDPLCVDEPWMGWFQAWLSKKNPQITRVGVGYMMAPGGGWGSNTDPFAMKGTPDNHWGQHTPHVMIVVPDTKALAGISTDPNNGGPYVMFPGTPYAHIMAPTTTSGMKH
jgi:hypothetical protein